MAIDTARAAAGVLGAGHHRGDNKPGNFTYTCLETPCNATGVSAWLWQACEGIGGSDQMSNNSLFDSTGAVSGGTSICLCAHGNTKEHNYTVSGDYPNGTVTLRFDVGNKETCQSAG